MVQSLADKRALVLRRSVGFMGDGPPNVVRLARALLGEHALSFVGGPDERVATVRSIARTHVFLQESASDEENALAIVQAIARWDIERTGPGLNVAALALALALPFEAMARFRAEGWTSAKIASEYRLPLDAVIARQATFENPCSVRRLRIAEEDSAAPPSVAPAAG